MAENKKSFILYADLIHTVRKLSKQKAGELFMTILSYVNDENPVVTDNTVDLVFEPVKQHLKRDLVKWEKFKEKQSANGSLGGRPKKETQTKPNNPGLFLESQKSLTVNDTVNATVNDIEDQKIIFTIEKCLEIALLDPRWVEANSTNKKELLEFNKVLEKRSVYERNAAEYKSHFANWKDNGKLDSLIPESGKRVIKMAI